MDYGSGASTLNGIFEWRDTVVRLVTVFLRFLQRNSISTQREAPNVSGIQVPWPRAKLRFILFLIEQS